MDWQNELKSAIRSVRELEGKGYAFLENPAILKSVEESFRVLVPKYYLNLIQPTDPNDPIALMAFPHASELQREKGFRDPIGDLTRQTAPRLTHRYPERALLHVTNLCPMYCRFCFRKNLMNENEEQLYGGDFVSAFKYLEEHPEIEEIILTGGDPWMLSDDRLMHLVENLCVRMKNLRRLRFHTRMLVTLPSRVTDGLLRVLHFFPRTYVVTHFNHPRELTGDAGKAVEKVRSAGVTILNQSVLLRGVNDSSSVLRSLFLGLGDWGVLPYYLHQCDQVAGAGHFYVPEEEGLRLWKELRGDLPGYLIPEYVVDAPSGEGKKPVGTSIEEKSDITRA